MRASRILTGLVVASLALAPALAVAKAGGGASMGSRGARTYSAPPSTNTAPSMAAPMDRSMAPRTPGESIGSPAGMPGRSSGFMSGLAGGLLGVGIGSMLFGGGLFGGGGFGLTGLLGLLIQGALLFFVGRWLFRRFAGQSAMAGGPAPRMAQPAPMAMQQAAMQRAAMQGAGAGGSMAVNKDDYVAFEQLLQGIQAAWSAQDTRSLANLATPEMAGYFAEQLADQASRGVVNSVTHVKLDQGDLSEAWNEGARDYATVAMKFSALDVTRDRTGRVVEGDLALRTMTTELWTFVRARGGRWILSAIQQVRS